MKIGDVSFWYADIGLPETRRPALSGDTTAVNACSISFVVSTMTLFSKDFLVLVVEQLRQLTL